MSGEESQYNLYKRFYDIWSGSFTQMLNEMMTTPQFAAMMGRNLEGSLDLKHQMDQWFETTLKGMRLPTSGDMKSLIQRVTSLEAQIHDLTEHIEELQRGLAKRAGR